MKNKCNECGRTVPNGYLHPLVTSKGNVAPICAPCALKITNEMHGINRLEFDGGVAEELRKKTLKHYEETKQ